MEKERQVRLADMRQEVQRNLDDRAGGAKAALRRRLAGRGLAAQAAMLSPRGKTSNPKPATPGTGSGTTPAPQAEAPKPAVPVPSVPVPQVPAASVPQAPAPTPPSPAGPVPATPVPEAEPPPPVPAAEPLAPIPGPPASLTGGARPLLRQGSSGPSVVELQSLLNQRDEVAQHLAVVGLFGPLTAGAVREFQAAHPPLAVDAVVGPMTWGALDGTSIEPQDATDLAKKLFKRGGPTRTRGASSRMRSTCSRRRRNTTTIRQSCSAAPRA